MKAQSKKTIFLLFVFYGLSSMVYRLSWAETELPHVLGVTGAAEVLRSSEKNWLPLTAPFTLDSGDRVRTREKSAVDIGLDRPLNGIARLGEKTAARVIGETWELEYGKMWVLWEPEEGSRGPLELRLTGMTARIEGGAYLHSDKGRTEIRSFGTASISAQGAGEGAGELAEGFRGVVTDGVAAPAQRLTYADYQDWRAWMTEAYRLKDGRASGRTAK